MSSTKVSRGSQLLQRHFSESRRNQAQLGERSGIKQYTLSKFASGARTPLPKDRALLEDHVGISWRAWDEPPAEEATGETGATFPDTNSSTGTDGVG
jgi:transcriptional regulator with XRE-family HTH domain